jgi:hypothetical protein
MNQAVHKEGHFFNEKQKNAKADIMIALINTFFDEIGKTKDIFNEIQSISDLIGSILVMFNRDIITHWLVNFNLTHLRKEILDDLFNAIKIEVDTEINRQKN